MNKVVVIEYDPKWPEIFETLRREIWPVVEHCALAIEHVGSTAVPGLAAKPIIDLDVIVESPKEVPQAIRALASLGYKHLGDLGISGREAFRSPTPIPEHHLYLCVNKNSALANHISVRDYLRSNPEEARMYGELKKSLASKHSDDIDTYMGGKTEFLTGILMQLGFSGKLVADISSQNKGGH